MPCAVVCGSLAVACCVSRGVRCVLLCVVWQLLVAVHCYCYVMFAVIAECCSLFVVVVCCVLLLFGDGCLLVAVCCSLFVGCCILLCMCLWFVDG